MLSTNRTPAEAIQAAMDELKVNVGGFAAAIDVSPQLVSFMRKGERSVPPDKAPLICSLTGGKVKRWELRPDDWHLIWPELIGTDGAPPAPAANDASHKQKATG